MHSPVLLSLTWNKNVKTFAKQVEHRILDFYDPPQLLIVISPTSLSKTFTQQFIFIESFQSIQLIFLQMQLIAFVFRFQKYINSHFTSKYSQYKHIQIQTQVILDKPTTWWSILGSSLLSVLGALSVYMFYRKMESVM